MTTSCDNYFNMYLDTKATTSKENAMGGAATEALLAFEDLLPEPEYMKRAAKKFQEGLNTSCELSRNSKRRKSSHDGLDMQSVLASIAPVEDSIAFPTIEWAYDDDEPVHGDATDTSKSCCNLQFYEEQEDHERAPKFRSSASTPLLGKRSRGNGLLRSKTQQMSLSSLVRSSTSSIDLSSECMHALNASSLPIFSDGSFSLGDAKKGLSTPESICLALSTAIA